MVKHLMIITLITFTGWPVLASESGVSRKREVADLVQAARSARTGSPVGSDRLDTRSAPIGIDGEGAEGLPLLLENGLAWLEANQNADGSWGDELEIVVTSSVLEALLAVAPDAHALHPGAAWLAAQAAGNHDFLARQTIALGGVPGMEERASGLGDELLAARNPAEPNTALPNWPEGGWGIGPGYETDSLTTALALWALDRVGLGGGFQVNDVALAPAGTNIHEWEIPADADKARLLVTVSGSEVRLCMTEGAPPPFCSWYFPLPPGGPYSIVFPDSGMPFTAGTNYVVVESTGSAATYSMTASYETATFDTRTLAEPLAYLREAQNPDGGWGLQRGQDTELYTTLHVLQSLLRYAAYDLASELANGIAYLETEQLGDGSFGYDGSPIAYVTALALQNLCPPGIEAEDAAAALLAMQELDGSWTAEAYDTALAILALWNHGDLDGDGVFNDGDCTGVSGDGLCPNGVTSDCDDNCPGESNPAQADVDDDLAGDLCDCDSGNGTVWAQPGQVMIYLTQSSVSDETRIGWGPAGDPGGSAPVVYDTLRSEDPTDFEVSATCLASDEPDTFTTDSDSIVPGDGYYYLVRAENDCPGPGSLGSDWLGTPRTGLVCP